MPDRRHTKNRFAHASTAAQVISLLTEAEKWGAPGIYFLMNRLDAAVATRAPAGKWHDAKKGESTTDREVTHRLALYIDFDARRPKGTSATDEQVQAALAVAGLVRGRLAQILGTDAVLALGMSGNGAALYVALDALPESPDLAILIKANLVVLKSLFATADVEVDISVSDAKRLCPAWGTTKRKGDPTVAERPHRQTGIVVPDVVERLDRAALEGLLEALVKDLSGDQRAEVDRVRGRKNARGSAATTEVAADDLFARARACSIEKVLERYGLRVGEEVTCPGCGTVGDGNETSVAVVGNGLKCFHGRCAEKGRNGYRSVVDVVMEKENVSSIQAVRLLGQWFGFEVPTATRKAAKRNVKKAAATTGGNGEAEAAVGAQVLDGEEADDDDESDAEDGEEDEADGGRRDRSQAVELVQLVPDDSLLADDRDDGYAFVDRDGHRELLRLRGKAFKSHLANRLYTTKQTVPGGEAISSALNVLEARARQGVRVKLWNRVARGTDGAIWIDLGDSRRRAVRVDASEWRVVDDPPPLFRRFSHQAPLPEPVRGGHLRYVLSFLNLASEADEILFVCSLVPALIPDVPQAVLILHGPQGSAKTTAARIRRSVVDPSAAPTLIVRRDLGEFVQALDHHYMPLLDNLSTMPDWMSDLLCQASTGGGFTKRELYSNADDILFCFTRPMVMTGVNVPATRPDLLDRSLLIRLARIAPEKRREEASFMRTFEAVRPVIFGGLLDALVGAMAIYDSIVTTHLPRLADFARWGAGAAEAAGYGAQAFLDAVDSNVARQVEEVLEGDAVAQAIMLFISDQKEWRGTSTRLLEALNGARGDAKAEQGWPKRAADLGRRLNELQPALVEVGVRMEHEVEGRGREKRRIWRLTWTPE